MAEHRALSLGIHLINDISSAVVFSPVLVEYLVRVERHQFDKAVLRRLEVWLHLLLPLLHILIGCLAVADRLWQLAKTLGALFFVEGKI